MGTLRRKIESLFERGKPKVEEVPMHDVMDLLQQQRVILPMPIPKARQPRYEMPTPQNMSFNLTTSDLPVDSEPITRQYLPNERITINYGIQLLELINRNAPQGFAQKLHNMLPYLTIGFFSWPSYWIWRGYSWQTRRQTERIGMYIHRTFQRAKLMQVAIFAFGMLMANTSTSPPSELFDVHEVSFNPNQKH